MSTPAGPKLVVVVGATGNQGGSVARRFLREGADRFRVRGLTRDPGSGPARELAALGAEVVRGDLNDVGSLEEAFKGANVIFSVTNYWEPFFPHKIEESREQAKTLGMGSVREYAGRLELAQGRNIADAAAATVDSLDANGFIASTLSHAERCSGGRLKELYHFDAKAEVFPHYVQEKHPKLAAKTSCVQTGFFMTSHRILPSSYFVKMQDGSFEMRFCVDPSRLVPHLDPVADMGNFVYAVYQSSWCGKEYMAEGTTCTFPDWIAAWSQATGKPATYRQVPREVMIKACGDEDFGGEIADMFEYTSDPGYAPRELLRADDLRKAGIDCPMTGLEDWMMGQDWSSVLAKSAVDS
ncbi:NAD(P)-binding protein [Diaporthe sp. PMI_573]|nr:NAD(P)-binding protein [Diaporthaceae sp. PMI_573]